jgi:hypothetical protein
MHVRALAAAAAGLAAACGSPPSPRPSIANAAVEVPPPAGIPSLYVALFEPGRTWRFPLVAEQRWNDGSGVQRKTTTGTVTCEVAHPFELPGGWRAELECRPQAQDPDVLDMATNGDLVSSPSGTYVGTPDGLWEISRFGEDIKNDVGKLDPARRLLAASPAVQAPLRSDNTSIEVTSVDGAWCYTQTYDLDGSSAGWSLCFREGDGLVGGNSFMWGVDTRLAYFGVAPRY